jgi:hypothetical protein
MQVQTTIDLDAIDFDRYAGPSSMRFRDAHGVTYYMSYSTLVGVRRPGHGVIVRRNDWGPTTGKHLNAIDGGDKSSRLDRDAFRDAVTALLSD